MRLFSALARLSPGLSAVPLRGSVVSPSVTAHHGTVGKGCFARNFRFLFVNGVGYEEWESKAAALQISELFGKIVGFTIKGHYSYLPMTFSDVCRAIRYNEEPQGCDALLADIRKLLQKVTTKIPKEFSHKKISCVCRSVLEGTGRLALFLHSGAGAFFKIVMNKLTHEERKHIDVFCFGSAWQFDKNDFHTVSNYEAYWDPFPLLGRLVSGQWFLSATTPLHPAGSLFQMPLWSHKFFRLPYQAKVQEIVGRYAKELRELPLFRFLEVTQVKMIEETEDREKQQMLGETSP